MALTSIDTYLAASKQKIRIIKASRVSVGFVDFSTFDLNGTPGAGTLAGSSTTVGVKPTDATAGCPLINSFGGGNTGYLTSVESANTIITRVKLWDMLFKAGAYSYAAGTTNLSTQPDISDRCPDYPGSGTVFGNGNEIWIEVSTAFVTGNNWQVQVTYTNSAGTTGRTSIISAAQAAAGLTQGKMFMLQLQSGDSGVQKIESVIVTNGTTAMTAGAFNVLILRPLNQSRIAIAGAIVPKNLLDVGAPIIYETSALIVTSQPDSTASGVVDVFLEISNV